MIEKFKHRCIVEHGDMAGNDFEVEVEPFHIEYGGVCDNCGKTLATAKQIVAHIYSQLTEDHR